MTNDYPKTAFGTDFVNGFKVHLGKFRYRFR